MRATFCEKVFPRKALLLAGVALNKPLFWVPLRCKLIILLKKSYVFYEKDTKILKYVLTRESHYNYLLQGSSISVCLFVCQKDYAKKNYWTDFHESWWKDGTWAEKKSKKHFCIFYREQCLDLDEKKSGVRGMMSQSLRSLDRGSGDCWALAEVTSGRL